MECVDYTVVLSPMVLSDNKLRGINYWTSLLPRPGAITHRGINMNAATQIKGRILIDLSYAHIAPHILGVLGGVAVI